MRACRQRADQACAVRGPDRCEIADWGVATESNEYFITEQRRQSLAEAQSGGDEWEKHGTIGAVARDARAISPLARPLAASPTRCTVVWVIRRCLVAARSPTVHGGGVLHRHRRGVHQGGRRPSGVGSCAFLRRERRGCRDGHFGRSRRASWRWRHDRSAAVGRGVVAYNSEMMNFGYRSAQGGKVQG